VIGAILSNPDVAENKIVEVVAETSAPRVDLREQLAALPVTGLTQAERREKQRREEEEAERKEQERREAGERDETIAPHRHSVVRSLLFSAISKVEFHLRISSVLTPQCCRLEQLVSNEGPVSKPLMLLQMVTQKQFGRIGKIIVYRSS
jgi:hypothetical protein